MYTMGKNKITGWKKSLLFLSIGLTVGMGVLAKSYYENKEDEINIFDNWICHETSGLKLKILHLNLNTHELTQNEMKTPNTFVLDDKQLVNNYTVYVNDKPYAEIEQKKEDRILYTQSKNSYSCDRSRSIIPINTFKGQWVGYLNSSKDTKLNKLEKEESKLVLTFYSDKVFIKGENLPIKESHNNLINSSQEKGMLTIKIETLEKKVYDFRFKIVNKDELILLTTPEWNSKSTYFHKVDTF